MSAEHRKPFVAFVALALAVVGLIGAQRADAQHGQVLAAAIGAEIEVRGQLPGPSDVHPRQVASRVTALGPAFVALTQGTDLADSLLLSRTSVPTLVPEKRATERTSPVVRVVPRSPRASEVLAQKGISSHASQRAQDAASGQQPTSAGAGGRPGQASSAGGRTPVRTPASSKASARATQAAAGAATGAKREATRNRAPRSVRTLRGR